MMKRPARSGDLGRSSCSSSGCSPGRDDSPCGPRVSCRNRLPRRSLDRRESAPPKDLPMGMIPLSASAISHTPALNATSIPEARAPFPSRKTDRSTQKSDPRTTRSGGSRADCMARTEGCPLSAERTSTRQTGNLQGNTWAPDAPRASISVLNTPRPCNRCRSTPPSWIVMPFLSCRIAWNLLPPPSALPSSMLTCVYDVALASRLCTDRDRDICLSSYQSCDYSISTSSSSNKSLISY